MTPATIIREAQADGVMLTISPAGNIKATGGGAAVNRWKAVIREHKAEIIDVLKAGAGSGIEGAEASPETNAGATPSAPLPAPAAADLPATDPDRWAWPHSDAMNGQELDSLMARQYLFHQRGASPQDAERLADSLVSRDRSDDARRLCLECKHLSGAGTYRCGNARAAGMHPDLALGFVQTLQRCTGYEDAKLPIGVKVDAAPPEPAPAPAQTRTETWFAEKQVPPQVVERPKTESKPTSAPTGPTWRELDLAYLFHHAQCPTCQSAGRGYGKRCEAGAALWRAYSECIQALLKKPDIRTKG